MSKRKVRRCQWLGLKYKIEHPPVGCDWCKHLHVEPHYWGDSSMTLIETDIQCLKGVHPEMSELVTIGADDYDTQDRLFLHGARCRHFQSDTPYSLNDYEMDGAGCYPDCTMDHCPTWVEDQYYPMKKPE